MHLSSFGLPGGPYACLRREASRPSAARLPSAQVGLEVRLAVDGLEARDIPEVKARMAGYLFILSETTLRASRDVTLRSVSMVPSLRFNGTSDFPNQLSPKLGFVFNFGEQWQTSLKGNLGWSYRAPTFNDLY